MTDPKVLADALVEAGIGEASGTYKGHPPRPWLYWENRIYWIDGFHMLSDEFITDWRVAGKVLEQCDLVTLEQIEGDEWAVAIIGAKIRPNESLPRAIIEAWYEARQ